MNDRQAAMVAAIEVVTVLRSYADQHPDAPVDAATTRQVMAEAMDAHEPSTLILQQATLALLIAEQMQERVAALLADAGRLDELAVRARAGDPAGPTEVGMGADSLLAEIAAEYQAGQ